MRLDSFIHLSKIANVRDRYTKTGDSLLEEIDQMQHREQTPSLSLKKRYEIDELHIKSELGYRINNTNKEKVIIYLPGGGFVQPITPFHWNFIQWLTKTTGYTVYVGLYPLTPLFDVEDVMAYVDVLYEKVRRLHPSSEVVMMGDSAGGDITLSYIQHRRTQELDIPDRLVCISPLVKLIPDHPKIPEIEPLDTIVAMDALPEIFGWYSGEHELDDPLVSPIFGDYPTDLPILIISGTRDLTNPDTVELVRKFPKIEYHEYPDLPHVFPFFPLNEASDAKDKISDFLQK